MSPRERKGACVSQQLTKAVSWEQLQSEEKRHAMFWKRNKLRQILLQPCHSPSGKQKPHLKSTPCVSGGVSLAVLPSGQTHSPYEPQIQLGRNRIFRPPPPTPSPTIPPPCRTQRAVTGYQPSPGPENREQPDLGKNLTCYVFWVSPGRNLYTVKDGGAENYMLWESWFTRLRLGERLCHLGHENSSYQMIAWSLWSVCGSIPAFVPFTATEPSRVISTGRSWECDVSTKTQLGPFSSTLTWC